MKDSPPLEHRDWVAVAFAEDLSKVKAYWGAGSATSTFRGTLPMSWPCS